MADITWQAVRAVREMCIRDRVYAFLSSFVMIYLTDTVGLNAGIVGTLIAVSKLFDGLTDVYKRQPLASTAKSIPAPWRKTGHRPGAGLSAAASRQAVWQLSLIHISHPAEALPYCIL